MEDSGDDGGTEVGEGLGEAVCLRERIPLVTRRDRGGIRPIRHDHSALRRRALVLDEPPLHRLAERDVDGGAAHQEAVDRLQRGASVKLTAIGATAGWFGSIGLPVPTVAAVVVGLLELVGGLAIVVGFKTRIAAAALAAFTIGATLIAHTDLADQVQQLFFLKNLSITGGLLFLVAFGAGALSIDGRRG